MTTLLIDTNIFLALYDVCEDVPDIFADLEKIKSHLIFPDIVFDEFVRNRDRILDFAAAKLRNAKISPVEPPEFIRSAPECADLERIADEYNRCLEFLAAGVCGMIDDPAEDPVYLSLSRLFNDPGVTTIRRTGDLVERAYRRKLIGNPPKSERRSTIGDELVWEMLLEHVRDDLVLVTRDATYKNHITFLMQEFLQTTGKTLTVTDRISAALRSTDVEPSEALLRFEGEHTGSIE